MNDTNGLKPGTKERDEFRFDSAEEDDSEIAGTFAEVSQGKKEHYIENRQWTNIIEQDVPTILLPGIISGATSTDKSEDPNFRPIFDPHQPPSEVLLTDQDVRSIQNASMRRYLIDPSYKGIIDVFIFFVIGKGFSVTAQDESEEVCAYLNKFMKVNGFDGRDRDIIKKSLKAGEVFLRRYTKNGEKQAEIPIIRFLNYWEITKINKDPKDNEKVVSYERTYRVEGSTEIRKETIPPEEIVHVKFAEMDENRGLPPFCTVIKRCVEYEDWLFNRIVFNRLKTCYYLEEIIDGSPAAVSAADAQDPNAVKVGMRGKLIKRMPKPGSKLIHNKNTEYKWLSPDVKADDAKEDGRAIRLSICAGAQIPEFVLGDSSQSNYASSITAQNPFIRKIEWLRDFYEAYFRCIFEWAIQYGIEQKVLPSMSQETVMQEKASHVTLLRKFKKMFKFKEQYDQAGNIVVKESVPTKIGVDFQWPNLIAQDILKDTQAYQIHQSMEIVSKETLSQKLGYDYEEEQRKMEKESESGQDQGPTDNQYDQTRQDQINPQDNITPGDGSGTGSNGE